MNTEEAVQYIEKLKYHVLQNGYPFKYSEFCMSHKPFITVMKKNMFTLFPVLQVKDTHQVILFMNQYGRHVTLRGKEGTPIYQFFGYIEPIHCCNNMIII